MKKTILLIIALTLLLSFSSAKAETKTFIREYTYQAIDIDNRDMIEIIALQHVKRLLLEELGTYLESETEVKNFQLTQDQVTAWTAGIVSTKIIEHKWDGKTYWVKARMEADPDDVTRKVDNLRNDKQKTRELELLKKKMDEQLATNEQLRKEIEANKADKAKIALYKNNISEIESSRLVQEAHRLSDNNKHEEAIELAGRALQVTSNPAYKKYAYLARGYFFFRIGNYNQAVLEYTAGIGLDDQDALLYSGRGKAYRNLNKLAEAIKDYNKAIELEPSAYDFFNRGMSYAGLDNDKQAIQDYTMAINLNPKYIDAYLARGFSYSRAFKHEQAISDMNAAINLNPQYAEAYSYRGRAFAKLGEFAQAIKDYDKAISLDAKNEDYYMARGVAYGKINNHQLAIIDFNNAIALNPKNSFFYGSRALSYMYLKEFQKAIPDLDHAIELEPNVDDYYNFRGICYGSLNDHYRALDDFTKAIEINPQNAKAHRNRSVSYGNIGKKAQAERDLNTAENLEQQITKEREALKLRAMVQEAEALFRNRDFEEAIKIYTKAISLSPNNVLLYRDRSRAYSLISDYENAINDLNKAIEINPRSADLYMWRGHAYGGGGDHYMAKENYSQAIRLVPNHSDAYYYRGWVKQGEGDKRGALADFNKGCKLGNKEACERASNLKKEMSKSGNMNRLKDRTQADNTATETEAKLNKSIMYQEGAWCISKDKDGNAILSNIGCAQ